MIGIKEFLLHKALNKKYYNLSYKSWKDIDNILLLFESDYPEKNSQIKNFIKQVKEDNKNIVSCCFVNKKKSDSATLDDYIVIDKSNVNIFGKPDMNHIGSIFNFHYDVIIDITENIVIPLAYILALVDYNFSCGVKKDNFNYYDFVLDLTSQQKINSAQNNVIEGDFSITILEQIIKYLKMVKSK